MKKTFVILTIISLLAGAGLAKNFQVSAHEGKSQEEIHESLSAQIHEHESSDENEDEGEQDEIESPEPSETPKASIVPTTSPTASPVASSTPSPSAVASATPSVSPTPTASPLVLGANVNGSLLETISNLLKQLIGLLQGQRD